MRIDLIGHASLLVSAGPLRLLTDPWWQGPAYHEQWYPYPFPVPERYDLGALDALYLSHGHEDHMHAPTLARLAPSSSGATVVLPRSYEPGNAELVRQLGFPHVEELVNGGRFRLARDGEQLTLTLFTALGDSMLAVEDGHEVLLDLNDALHYARTDVIDAYCKGLRARFPRIDYLFCGYGGASYFPNCFRIPGKDDQAVAERRERTFLENFARIIRRLRPRFAFPFAAGFVLPDPRNWWVSVLRLKMPPPSQILAPWCRDLPTEIHDLQPGDFVENGVVHGSLGAPPRSPDEVRAAVLERYPTPPRPARIEARHFRTLVERTRANALANVRRLGPQPLDAAILLSDFPDEAILVHATFGRARVETSSPARAASEAPELQLETRSDLYEATLTEEYGRDQICIGYGALVRVGSRDAVRANLHERLFRLIAPFSTWGERLRRHPLLCMGYLARDLGARHAVLQKLQHLGRPPSPVYALEEWT